MRLTAENISFRYPGGHRWVLRDLSIALESGERVGLYAPSGSGKTTLCRILAGYAQPAEGQILLDGRPLPKRGYCPVQLVWQHPEQAVDPRSRMSAVLREGEAVDARILRELGIRDEWMSRFPGELSGGELQRFCLARALGERTRFLLADEISAMLDLVTQRQIWNFLMEETERRGIGLLAVSHSPELLKRVCTRRIDLR